MENKISITEIAKIHGKHNASVHRLVKRKGIETFKERSDKARGQNVTYITTDDYEDLKQTLGHWDAPSTEAIGGGSGVFYIVQLEPHHDPGRFKVGYTTDIAERLRSHRTAAPFSKMVKEWPCKLLWEKTAIECVSQDCEQLYTEVFRANDIAEVVNKAEQFFNLMPPTRD